MITPHLDEMLGKLPRKTFSTTSCSGDEGSRRAFRAGKMQLPFVLRSAEAMKKTVDLLHGHFTSRS
jgi:hypothetical protein